MEELLHERLRELKGTTANEIREREEVIHSDELLDKWADEIERYYIPRPRFEDGEPVQFGDATDELYHVDTISFYEDGGISLNSVDDEIFLGVGKTLKRPTPKVFDANGVEVKVGQKRWGTEGGNEYDVLEIKPDGSLVKCGCPSNDELFVWLAPSQLTNERPVFDAEGVRICNGDTVWHVGDASRGTVVGIIMDNTWHGYPVKVAWDKGDEGFYQGNALTNREPDSLESIAKYAKDEAVKYAGCIEPLNKLADRLAAIIERGA